MLFLLNALNFLLKMITAMALSILGFSYAPTPADDEAAAKKDHMLIAPTAFTPEAMPGLTHTVHEPVYLGRSSDIIIS